jgi:hypothetical protein
VKRLLLVLIINESTCYKNGRGIAMQIEKINYEDIPWFWCMVYPPGPLLAVGIAYAFSLSDSVAFITSFSPGRAYDWFSVQIDW